MSEKLKPCPFCGHKATKRLSKKLPSQSGEILQRPIVLCASPHCPVGPAVDGFNDEDSENRWNTRAEESRLDRAIELLGRIDTVFLEDEELSSDIEDFLFKESCK